MASLPFHSEDVIEELERERGLQAMTKVAGTTYPTMPNMTSEDRLVALENAIRSLHDAIVTVANEVERLGAERRE